MLRIVAILGWALGVAHGSIFCPHTAVPSDENSFRSMMIEFKQRDGQQPMYRIVDSDNLDKSFKVVSEEFKLLTRVDNSECPGRSCVTELSAAMPRHQGSVLYLTNIVGKLIPPGFTPVEVKNRLYCTIMEGDCGATVPIYRYYKFTTSGLFHAYATEDAEIEGFSRETMPLCWAWPVSKEENEDYEEEAGDDEPELTSEEKEQGKKENLKMITLECSKKSKKPIRSSMKSLNVWKNNRQGAFMDHYYTTKRPGKDYEYDDTIGLVVVDPDKSKCNCLVRLTQMVDSKTEGLWARLDHKLVSDYMEPPPNAGEEYTSIEEEVFCVKEEGACGATVPLRKFFKFGNLDTIYTVNDANTPPFSIPSPPGVLCYIWPSGKEDLPKDAYKQGEKADEDEEDDEEKKTITASSKKDEQKPVKKEKKVVKGEPTKANKSSKKSMHKEEKKTTKTTTKKQDERKIETQKNEKKEKSTTSAPEPTTAASTTVEVTQTTTVKKEEPSTTTVQVTSTIPSTTEAVTEKTTTSSESPSSSVEPTTEMKKEKVETTTEASTTSAPEVKVEETTASSSTVQPEKPVDEPKSSESSMKSNDEKKEQMTTAEAPESSSSSPSTESPKEASSSVPESTTVAEETTTSKQ